MLIKPFFIYFRIHVSLKKITCISLSLILLLGNIGVTFGTHICDGQAVVTEVMFGEKHLDCGMVKMDLNEVDIENQYIFKPQCCDNQYLSIDIEEHFKIDISHELAPIFVALAVSNIPFTIELDFNVDRSLPGDSCPPFPKQDFQIFYQLFLI